MRKEAEVQKNGTYYYTLKIKRFMIAIAISCSKQNVPRVNLGIWVYVLGF